jgi:hypothetical protein
MLLGLKGGQLTEQTLKAQLGLSPSSVRSKDFINPNGPWFQPGTATLALRRNALSHFLWTGGGSAQTEPT